MHKYLRSIGFSKYKRNKEIKEILKKVIRFSTEKKYVSGNDDIIWAEYRKSFGENFGISVCGEYTEENEFEYEYYFPYYNSDIISSSEKINIERHAEKDSFSGVCDEYKVGVSLIFYLQNRMDYLKELMRDSVDLKNTSVSLSGLSVSGSIMLPLNKSEYQLDRKKKNNIKRNQLLAKARAGDEQAIESLTIDDMDKYNMVSKQILKQDIYSLVDTYFMPYGVECDHYSILAEIIDVKELKNDLTKEEIYIISMNCNDLNLQVCINKIDLIGEPAPKRRFKGVVWLQGVVSFS